MKLDGLLGIGRIGKILEEPSHAYIISGAKGSGKRTLCGLMAKAFVCEKGEKDGGCGKCLHCRKASEGIHPDIIFIECDGLSVKELRLIVDNMSLRPNEAINRCFIFENADKLSAKCQNVMLKPVEEPASHLKFIFICENKDTLLTTLRSRCVILEMPSLEDKDILDILSAKRYDRYSEEDKLRAIAYSQGHVGTAIGFLTKGTNETLSVCEKFSYALMKKDVQTLLSIVKFKERTQLVTFTEGLLEYFRLHLRALYNEEYVGLSKQVCGLGEKRLCALCEKLERINSSVKNNINVQLWSVYTVSECLQTCFRYNR